MISLPAGIEDRQVELDAFILEHFGPDEPVTPPPARCSTGEDLSDTEVIRQIRASKKSDVFQQLWQGDFAGHPSRSEADLALCNTLAFWTRKNPEQIDRLFRMSGLMRDKWDQKHGSQTYGAMTIAKAITGSAEVYGERSTVKRDDQPKSQRCFSLVHLSQIVSRAPDWLIQGMLERDSIALLFSDPGVGKSFLGVGLACCIATGTAFYERVVTQGPVVFVAGEGQNGLKRRFSAWEIRNRIALENAPIFISTVPAALLDKESATQVSQAVDEIAQEHGTPVLIVIDTLARNFGPGDENRTEDMGTFIQAVDALRAKYRAAILLIHHNGHADKTRARGAMALKGALDFEYQLSRGEDKVIRLECSKIKDFEQPEPMAFKLCSVALPIVNDDGTPVTSAVLEPTAYTPLPTTGKTGRGKNQTIAVAALKQLINTHRGNLERGGLDPDSAKVAVQYWQEECLALGIDRKRFSEASKSLEHHRVVSIENGFVYLVE